MKFEMKGKTTESEERKRNKRERKRKMKRTKGEAGIVRRGRNGSPS